MADKPVLELHADTIAFARYTAWRTKQLDAILDLAIAVEALTKASGEQVTVSQPKEASTVGENT